jgi:hypothetical protein
MSTDAITPSRSAILKLAKEGQEIEKKIEHPDDIYLHELAQNDGWKVLKQHIERRIEALKPHFDFESSDDEMLLKSYGLKSLLYDIVSEQLNGVIKKVETTSDVISEQKGK